jgi:hypothetical protein
MLDLLLVAIECNSRDRTLETSTFVLGLHMKEPTGKYLQIIEHIRWVGIQQMT